MSRYDRSYDYGLRGYRQTTRPMMRGYRTPSYDLAYDLSYDERVNPGSRPNRVTARYNMDYVVGYRSDPRNRRNYSMYTGDRMDRMGDERYYRQPYMTIGGTRTLRGSSFPIGYDYPVYGPNYGGRYPDEL